MEAYSCQEHGQGPLKLTTLSSLSAKEDSQPLPCPPFSSTLESGLMQ